jgi:hypothetical protein
MANQLLKADYKKELYKIEITVCENGNLFTMTTIDKDYKVTYQSLIGTMEIMKNGFMNDQTEANKKSYKKQFKTKK